VASNKNQHYVPRCYFRPFSTNSENVNINIFNIDSGKFIEKASIKHQCSGNYFYGEDTSLETALQSSEGLYASVLREILNPDYQLTKKHKGVLQHFWLLQHMRTEAASKRSVEFTASAASVAGLEAHQYRLSIKDAVLQSMKTFVQHSDIVDDLEVCLIRNKTRVPFFTSDDPAILTNRWYMSSRKAAGGSFGLSAAGNIILLPLSPNILSLGYDKDVYSIPNKNGWVEITADSDLVALNEHQFLNCRANIFIHDAKYKDLVLESYKESEPARPKSRHKINYAILDQVEKDGTKMYRIVDMDNIEKHEEALIHTQEVHPAPTAWPKQIRLKSGGSVYSNGSALGFVRRAYADSLLIGGFQKEPLW